MTLLLGIGLWFLVSMAISPLVGSYLHALAEKGEPIAMPESAAAVLGAGALEVVT